MGQPLTSAELLSQAERQWTALRTTAPDLTPAIALQRRLLTDQIALLDALRRGDGFPAGQWANGAEKIRRGVPALRGEEVEVPAGIMEPFLDHFCQSMADGGATDVANHLLETMTSGRLDRRSLLMASIARDRRAIEQGATQLGVSPDLTWLVGELATAPLAHLAKVGLLDTAGPAAAISEWEHGYCPICGSWPALAEVRSSGRELCCSYCGATWHADFACAYCGEEGEAFTTTAADSSRRHHLVELCDACGGYTKSVQVDGDTPFPLVAILDLASLELDRFAAARGYHRPPLPEL